MRSTRPASGGSMKKVSCICRAGWSAPRLRASKFSHSDSTSGPSAISQPIATKMSSTRSETRLMGWRAPSGRRGTRTVRSTGLLDEDALVALGLELLLAGLERLCHLAARLADPLAGLGLGAGRQGADLAVGQRQRALLPLVGQSRGLELVEGARRGDRGLGVSHRPLDGGRVERGNLDGVVLLVGSRHAYSLWAFHPWSLARRPESRGRTAAGMRLGEALGAGGTGAGGVPGGGRSAAGTLSAARRPRPRAR